MNIKNIMVIVSFICSLTLNAQPFSIMTYNIRCGHCDDKNSNNWDSRKELLLSVIKKNNADLIGFQEIIPMQLEYLKMNLPEYAYFGSGRDADGLGEGCYIFYKKKMFDIDSLHSGTKWYSSTPDIAGSNDMGDKYNRIITYIRFKNITTKKYFYHFNTHLTYLDSIQVRYVDFLSEVIRNRKQNEPFVLTGDFNANEDSPAIKKLLENFSTSGLVDSYRQIHKSGKITTFNNFTGVSDGQKIDYIFIENSKFKAIDARCDSTVINGKYASDHNAVCAELKFR